MPRGAELPSGEPSRLSGERALPMPPGPTLRHCSRCPASVGRDGRRTPANEVNRVLANPVRVLLLEHIHPEAVELLQSHNFQVTSYDRALDEHELIEAIDGIHLLGIRSKTQVTDRVLDA